MRKYERKIKTPKGDLINTYYQPKDGSPGYVGKHYIESVEDAEKWLSIPHRVAEPNVEVDSYFELKRKTGDRTMLMVNIGEAMYSVQALMGSEVFSIWLVMERELLHEMIQRSYANIGNLVKHYLSHDVGDCYGWVGPELCIPPLASPEDFREFVFKYDKPIIDLIHDAGKLAWVHCHGDMKKVLMDFVEMGVDCLNPIEPPPVGGLTLAEAKEIIGGQMTLDGGVQNGNFELLEPEKMEILVEETVAMGKPGGCYILSETGTPSTWPELTEKHIANYTAFIETGIRLANYD
jgi:uroporphyrinogen-III decarboxylase